MNSIAVVIFFAAVAAASAGIVAPSGLIAPGLTAYSTPFAYNGPLAYNAHLAAPAYTAYSSPIAYPALGQAAENTVIAGPSGTITNTKTIATPALAARYSLPSSYAYGGLYL